MDNIYGSIKYNKEKMSDAIIDASKASAFVSDISNGVSNVSSVSLPENSPISSSVYSLLDDIKKSLDEVVNYEIELKNIYSIMENVEKEKMTEELVNLGYERIEVKSSEGIEGLVFVPKGHTSTEGLPMITYLAGYRLNTSYASIEDNGLGYLANNGYILDALIYIPVNENRWGSYVDDGKLISAINEIATTNNVDKNRCGLITHSVAGDAGYRLVAKNPNYFSYHVSYSSSISCMETFDKYEEELKNSGTLFMTFINHYSIDDQYERLNEMGVDVIGYNFRGEHEDAHLMYSSSMLTDIINIEKGKKYLKDGNKLIDVSKDDITTLSLVEYIKKNGSLKGYNSLENTFYHRLTEPTEDSFKDYFIKK